MSYDPDLETTLTFPAESIQHQLSIMTLTTHVFLSIPIIHQPQISWTTLWHSDTYELTLHITLVTAIINRYHNLWYTALT